LHNLLGQVSHKIVSGYFTNGGKLSCFWIICFSVSVSYKLSKSGILIYLDCLTHFGVWSVIDVILREQRNFSKVNLNLSLSLVEMKLKTVVVPNTKDKLVQFERFLLQKCVKTENLSSQLCSP